MTNETLPLSEREREILVHVANGRTNQQIAADLEISINTVKVHVRNIFAKIGAASRTEAAVYAMRAGLVPMAVAPPPETSTAEPVVVLPELTEPAPAPVAASPLEVRAPAAAAPRRLIWGAAAVLVLLVVGGVLASALTRSLPTGGTPTAQPASAPPSTNWSAQEALPAPRAGAAAISYRGRILLIGGETADGVSADVLRFDPSTRTWTTLAAKPTATTDIQAVELGGRIYIPGGRQADGTLSDRLEVFDPATGSWSQAASLPAPRSSYALAAVEGRLYLLGGWDGQAAVADVLIYDPETDRWTTGTAMPNARAYAAAAVFDAVIYVIGGERDGAPLAAVEGYTPALEGGQPWQPLAPLPQPTSRLGAVSVVNLAVIYALGGTTGAVARYDVRADAWQPLADAPPQPLSTRPAATLRDGSIYLLGGDQDGLSDQALEFRAVFTTTIPAIQR